MRYTGILPIHKPRGMTSHDVIYKARRLLNMKKIGHTGTLDPDVEGVLVLCLGHATKLVEYIMDSPKTYAGEVTLGFSTETEDASGEVVDRIDVTQPPTDNQIDAVMADFVGSIIQVPPYYSAVKVNGRRLYEYARLGETVERPQRNVDIYSFKRTNEPFFSSENTYSWDFYVECSKGTYVRTLAVDVGKKLGYPAHMSKLIRLSTGGYTLADATSLDDLETFANEGRLAELIRPTTTIKSILPSVEIKTKEALFLVSHGQVVHSDFFDVPILQPTAVFYHDKLVAIYEPHPEKPNLIKPTKVLNEQQER